MQTNRRRRGFSLIELLIVIAIILILAMIAVPKVNQQLMSARETAAIQEIKTIHQAETQYYSTFGKYAASLAELGPPASGAAGPAAADLIPKSLADGKNGGYIYAVIGSASGLLGERQSGNVWELRPTDIFFRPDPGDPEQLVSGTGHRQ